MRKKYFPVACRALAITFLLSCVHSQISAQVPAFQALFKERFSLYVHVLKARSTQLPDIRTLQDNFGFFINRERDRFEYDLVTALAGELDTRVMDLAVVTQLIEKTIEKIIHKIIEPYEKTGSTSTIDMVGIRIEYMMLFLAAIFQNDRASGQCIFETYIKILGLDTDDDVEVMKNHERVAP